MSTVLDCVFCGFPKEWMSAIQIVTIDARGKVTSDNFPRVSVCPKCRKEHTISELYEKIVETLRKRVLNDVTTEFSKCARAREK